MAGERKLGEGSAAEFLRLGLREFREITMPFPEQIAKEEFGMVGNPTPGEIARDREVEKDIDLEK